MAPRLSVVVPVYNNWWLTARALRALDKLRGSTIPFETIVVDNASSDETPNAIAAFPWVRYVREEQNRNFAGACNAGARLAEGPLTLFLNNDAYPLGDAFAPLVAAFDDSKVCIAGGALFFEDGVTQCAGFVVLPNAHWHYSCRNFPADLDSVTQSRDALAVSGAAMAVRTQWFVDQGGFDESYVNGFEDVDLCMRARERGRAIRYVARARFAHYEAASSGRYAREAENEAAFYHRWSTSFAGMPRTARGEVGAISVHPPRTMTPALAAGLADLEQALRAFGHPLVRGGVPPWRHFDRRFRMHGSLHWFTSPSARPGVSVESSPGKLATIQTRGAAELRVPWLPCASDERVARLPLRASLDPACTSVAVAGFESASAQQKRAIVAALAALGESRPMLGVVAVADGDTRAADLASLGARLQRVDPAASDGRARAGVACVLHAGFTDDGAFGTVALAQLGLPAITLGEELAALFPPDVALVTRPDELSKNLFRLLDDTRARMRYGASLAADARRRFSPRRCAIRVVDLLCAARFGLERSAAARTNSPLAR